MCIRDRSKAKTTSTPSLFIVFSLVPIFGLVNEMIKKEMPKRNMINFKVDLKVEEFGANFFNKDPLENLRCVLFFHHNTSKKRTTIAGMIVRR